MPQVTLADVARAAGVHKATAARALNRDPRITPATRRRVEEAAAQLGYKVNHLLSAWMSTRRTRVAVASAVIAYVTGHPTRYGWRPPASDLPDFFPGALARAEQAGFKLEDFWLRERGMTPERFTGILRTRGIQGVLIGRMPGSETTLLEYDWSGFSVAALGVSVAAPIFHRVRENHFHTASLAASQCHQRGVRRIGLAFDRADDVGRMNDMWVGGFLSEQVKWPRGSYRVPPLLSHTPDPTHFRAWFRKHRPDVLIVSQAEPVRTWLAEERVAIPDDVGLVDLRCYDPRAGTTGVHYDFSQTGAVGVEMLIGLLHRQERGVPGRPQEVLLEGKWIEGETLRSPMA
ncbi:LacI family DNA-binding transcriptional regulator [Congregicoccus parvus]|uniref:LacI family DNA-binding transcriptional regulator n=1 Tax=Congregicoccus parvus TaxID=3081749 RepID=UPI003FA5C7ED